MKYSVWQIAGVVSIGWLIFTGATLHATSIQGVTIWLKNGEKIRGELIHRYDHEHWWDNPSKEITYALFEPKKFALYPNDRSITIISSSDIQSKKQIPSSSHTSKSISYRDFLRKKQIVIEQSPLHSIAHVLTGHEKYHLEENGYGDFAWDLSRTNERGERYKNKGFQNSDYFVWGSEVFLPTSGYVIEVVRDYPDNRPGTYEAHAPNNLVGIHLGGAYYLYLLHFQQNSIPENIQVGKKLPAGTYLGRVGNSGVTLEPHLHLTLLWYDVTGNPARTWSVPIEFKHLYLKETKDKPVHFFPYVDPPGGSWFSSKPF